MNFSQLKYFMAVAENLNITATAKKLYISQQALSSQITQLEKELNTVLLERTHPLRLTEAGQRLYSTGKQMLFLERQLHSELSDISDSRQHTLSLGTSSAYARSLLPQLLRDFFRRCPNARLELREVAHPQLGALLTEHKVDMIMGWPLLLDNTVNIPVLTEFIYLVIPSQLMEKEFGDQAEAVARQLSCGKGLHLLSRLPFILPRSGSIRDSCDALFLREQICPKILVESDWLETSIRLCQTGLGCTFAAGNMLSLLSASAPELQIFSLTNAIEPRGISLYYLKSTYLSRAMKAFIGVCRDTALPTR